MPSFGQIIRLALLASMFLAHGCKGSENRSSPPDSRVSPGSTVGQDDITWGFSEGLARIEVAGKRGFIDKTGRVVIQARFDKAWDFHCGRAMVEQGGKKGYIDLTGRVVIEAQFAEALDFSEGFAAVKKDGLWGFMDPSGKFIIAPIYAGVDRGFSEGLAAVSIGKLYGFIDKTGKFVVKRQCDCSMSFSQGRAAVRRGRHWAYINKDGKEVTPFRFASAGRFLKDPPVAYVNIPNEFAAFEPGDPNDKFGPSPSGGTWCFIDRGGNVVFGPPPGVDVDMFNEGLCMAINRRSMLCGYMDLQGTWKIKPQFEGARVFSEGLGAVRHKGRWGYVNKAGTMIIKPSYELASPFRNGFARVAVDGSWGYIDRNGTFLWKPTR